MTVCRKVTEGLPMTSGSGGPGLVRLSQMYEFDAVTQYWAKQEP